ncbi:tRNA-guanine transglycosylase DpdA [Streptomyces albidoflavus]|uniref:tRNA-guanine transglycosylase DpdA n=1 Tax=Streptomyces albidoflavus TaxID=1886 RepID=UPI00101F1AA2|nr:tRNA-guanine transglycosylase DpdA [Streptomyces albidoflavus]RZD80075.1 queuine/other tRNA-ribosyltransferase [Streptomyces albidoflavus]RZE24095.1 queuine/other tRNA-ribosyltransferase [Streptomyces albidoflavus]RZE44317.1 queuine/other tRNA-ribosyltransferase [Streptomyces albidoflavus]
MKFYFPDSQDQVSPSYDFLNDEYSDFRVRQRDDRYAHQVVTPAPYKGILVSKAIVDGSVKGAGKYTAPQRQRLYRLGVREFFRLPEGMDSLGDCGAFNYVDEKIPPYSVEEVLDFYEGCQFDEGVSIDHVIFGYQPEATDADVDPAWAERRRISLRLAEEFLAGIEDRKSKVIPFGAAQGWSPTSYADSVAQLQDMGYKRIALGGMVPLKTHEIMACLDKIDEIRDKENTKLHLLGITRISSMEEFSKRGVASFDSTSAFRQAFMDERSNFHTAQDTYTAVRVPQVDGNPTLKRQILAGVVSQSAAIKAERECLHALRAYGSEQLDLTKAMVALETYLTLVDEKKWVKYHDKYKKTLADRPWKHCSCLLCKDLGVEIVIFRGTERNKRRGFHNMTVLQAKMSKLNFT